MSFTSISSTELYNKDTTRVSIKKRDLLKKGYKNFQEWKSDPKHLYIGDNLNFYIKGATKSIWAIPQGISIDSYKNYILSSDLKDRMNEILNYEELGCWCGEDGRCHGDILIEIANDLYLG